MVLVVGLTSLLCMDSSRSSGARTHNKFCRSRSTILLRISNYTLLTFLLVTFVTFFSPKVAHLHFDKGHRIADPFVFKHSAQDTLTSNRNGYRSQNLHKSSATSKLISSILHPITSRKAVLPEYKKRLRHRVLLFLHLLKHQVCAGSRYGRRLLWCRLPLIEL